MDVTLEKLVYRVPKVQRGVIRQSLRQKDRGEAETAGPRSAGLCFFFGLRASPRPVFCLPAKERVYGKFPGDVYKG